MQIERSINGIKTLGPGNRFVIWVNGCNRRCKGCVSERLQKFEPRNEQNLTEYLSQFNFSSTDGITISGGEPFEQIDELLKAIRFFQEMDKDDILIYTGYTIEELQQKNDERINEIISSIAVLIDGPYIEELNNDIGNLKGSENQRVLILNEKYRKAYQDYYCDSREMQEIRVGPYHISVGIPTKKYINEFNSNINGGC